MTDAPERIWADAPEIFDGCDIWRDKPVNPKATEYTRADLSDAKDARIAELEAKLAVLSKSGQSVVDRWDSIDWKDEKHTADYINDLRATLAQMKGTDQ